MKVETVKVKARVRNREKKYEDWQEFDTATIHHIEGFTPGTAKEEYSRYGGWKNNKKYEATGFFHARKVGDRWWLVDPEGYLFIHKAVVHVVPGRDTETTQKALQDKFGTKEKWAEHTLGLLRENAFNGAGAWSEVDLIRNAKEPVPYTCMWNFMNAYGKERGGTYQLPGNTGYPNQCIFVFDPQFEEFCDRHAKQLAQLKDDPYLLGHFSDNELPFPEDLLNRYLALDKEDWGYKGARKWLDEKKGKDAGIEAIDDADRDEFIGYVADRYFEITGKAIRKYDPNHLFIGSRYHANIKFSPGGFMAAGKHLDVISINYYDVWTPRREDLANWNRWSDKPVMITEWYTKGADTGMPNTGGAGWIVETQKDRGLFYQNFALTLLESKTCVGFHWFRYIDNDPNDLTTDPSNRDSNKGIVTIKFEEYVPLLEKMKEFNQEVYNLIEFMDSGN